MLAEREVSPSPPAIKPKPATPPVPVVEKPAQPADDLHDDLLDDESFLRRAFEGVRPLNSNGHRRSRIPLEPPVTHTIVDEDAEVVAQLSDLVSGQAPFDITESDEYLEDTASDWTRGWSHSFAAASSPCRRISICTA